MSEIFNFGNEPEKQQQKDIERHEDEGSVRTLSLVCTDGMQQCLNYSYLMSRQLSPGKDAITLSFTSHTVVLKGSNLQALFNDFARDIPKKIMAVESRYAATKENDDAVIAEIVIQPSA
ncbi:MAG: hypothetical protein JSS82_09900 [Bacteroidetes bacterium]|nr:hypothetical protein [Bacteroidota bacterium]